MTTLEQVEKLRAMANISYDEAKVALDASNGDLLEAIIYLEKQGKVITPIGGGYYSSQRTTDTSAFSDNQNWENQTNNCNNRKSFTSLMKRFGTFCLEMVRKGNANTFEVLKDEESKASIPVTVLALLLIFAFWITIPLIVIGLFFGFRYRFHGPDLSGKTVNDAMNSAANAAVNLKKSIDK